MEFKNFFKEGNKESMARLLSFMCGGGALVVSIAALWLGLKGQLTWEYVALATTLWAAAFGGKNWSKNIENKRINNG